MDPSATDAPPPATESALFGARWAAALGAALVLALALLTAVRWFGRPANSAEQVVQVPVPAVAPTPTPRPEVLAPDPGDNP